VKESKTKQAKIVVRPHQPARLWDDVCAIVALYIESQQRVNGKSISINRAINELIQKSEATK
jgi:hypothetical protein